MDSYRSRVRFSCIIQVLQAALVYASTYLHMLSTVNQKALAPSVRSLLRYQLFWETFLYPTVQPWIHSLPPSLLRRIYHTSNRLHCQLQLSFQFSSHLRVRTKTYLTLNYRKKVLREQRKTN